MNKTRFQEIVVEKCKSLLIKYFKDDISFTQEGRDELYYHAKISLVDSVIDIYIYEDEAGYMLNNKDWKIFERPDYKSVDILIGEFLDQLEQTIMKVLGAGAES